MEQHRQCFADGNPAVRVFTSTRGPAHSSLEPGQGACRHAVQPGCDPGQGPRWRVSSTVGPSHAPAPVPPDGHHDRGTSDAEVWARSFGFCSGISERQYCSVCQPCPFWQSHPVSSKRVSCPELPSLSLFGSPGALCSFACMDGTIHSNTNTSPSQPS